MELTDGQRTRGSAIREEAQTEDNGCFYGCYVINGAYRRCMERQQVGGDSLTSYENMKQS
jgi:hypothetical protein